MTTHNNPWTEAACGLEIGAGKLSVVINLGPLGHL
jgi:hypothetical protein